jgi:hypothetical protein
VRLGLVLAAGIALLGIAVAVALAESESRRAGSNYAPLFGPAAELKGRGEHCQDEGLVPADAAMVRMLVGTDSRPTPAFRVTVREADGTLLSAGRVPGGGEQGVVEVPLDRAIQRTRGGVVVCLATGPTKRTVFFGAPGRVRFEWFRPGEESWLELVPTLAHRFGLGKGISIGDWLLVLVALLVLASWVLALRLLTRELAQ